MRRGFALGLRNEMKLERKNNISWCHPTIVKSLRTCHMNQNKYWLLYLFHVLFNIVVAHKYIFFFTFSIAFMFLLACLFYISTSKIIVLYDLKGIKFWIRMRRFQPYISAFQVKSQYEWQIRELKIHIKTFRL